MPDSTYALGHSAREVERLSVQARLIDPITRRFLAAAGITASTRVLDVGCGAGDTTLLVAELVGSSGEVVGADRSTAAIAVARARVGERSRANVSFQVCDPAEAEFANGFDAVVGALRAHVPRRSRAHTGRDRPPRPGGIVMFHEPDWDGARSTPPAPTYDLTCRWAAAALQASGHHIRMGSQLTATFLAAALPDPSLRLESAIGAGTGAADCLHLAGDLIPVLLDATERFEIATVDEIDLSTLPARLEAEASAAGSVIIGRSEIGAWATG